MKIEYSVTPKHAGAHLISVSLKLTDLMANKYILKIPRWMPGSYKIRDFARFIQIRMPKSDNYRISKISSYSWQLDLLTSLSNFTLEYTVYANEKSVRGNFFDSERLYLNFCALLFDIEGYSTEQIDVNILPPVGWNAYTSLDKKGENKFVANSYEELIDSPYIAAKNSLLIPFDVQGITHNLVLTNQFSNDIDVKRLKTDLGKICSAQMDFFKGTKLKSYYFLATVLPNTYGGIEYSSSTVLAITNEMLPKIDTAIDENYIEFLGLCSHEYFHLYNVKRIRPKSMVHYNLYSESHTNLLWFFEGVTSYYDNLMLLRADVIGTDEYYKLLSKIFTRVYNTDGRFLTTLQESSFDAWTSLYMADENTANVSISYYTRGSLFAFYLDLWLRQITKKFSFDNVMLSLWQDYGVCFDLKKDGITTKIIIDAVKQFVEPSFFNDVDAIFKQGLDSCIDFDFKPLLTNAGIDYMVSMQCIPKTDITKTTDCGFTVKEIENNLVVDFVNSHKLDVNCIIGVGDIISELNGYKVTCDEFMQRMFANSVGVKVEVKFLRQGLEFKSDILLFENSSTNIELRLKR